MSEPAVRSCVPVWLSHSVSSAPTGPQPLSFKQFKYKGSVKMKMIHVTVDRLLLVSLTETIVKTKIFGGPGLWHRD